MSEAEDIVLKLLAAHTPPGRCPLAGNSVGEVILLQCRYLRPVLWIYSGSGNEFLKIADPDPTHVIQEYWYLEII